MKREQIIETLKNPHWFFFGKLFESDFEQITDAILALESEKYREIGGEIEKILINLLGDYYKSDEYKELKDKINKLKTEGL